MQWNQSLFFLAFQEEVAAEDKGDDNSQFLKFGKFFMTRQGESMFKLNHCCELMMSSGSSAGVLLYFSRGGGGGHALLMCLFFTTDRSDMHKMFSWETKDILFTGQDT